MKTLKLEFVLFLFCALLMFSCTQTADEVNPETLIDQSTDTPLFQQQEDGDLIEIGFIEGGEFHFTVSDDQLASVYSYNVETNLEESGQLESATVIPSDNEDESAYYLVMSGTLAEEGSAVLSAEVITTGDDPEAMLRVFISPRPVWAGICYYINCSQCRQSDLSATVRSCRCNSNFTINCPYVEDPTIVWTF